jgi:hypothetical protein
MKKTTPALALVVLMALAIPSLFAAETAPLPVFDQPSTALIATRQGVRTFIDGAPAHHAKVITLAGDFGWLQPSLTTAAHAAPAPVAEEHQPAPLDTGAWFIVFGLLAFVISRKRFNK